MSIITWIEKGQKQFAVFESRFFESGKDDFPVFESHHASFRSILAFSEAEVVMVSGDRKRFRRVQPLHQQNGRNRQAAKNKQVA